MQDVLPDLGAQSGAVQAARGAEDVSPVTGSSFMCLSQHILSARRVCAMLRVPHETLPEVALGTGFPCATAQGRKFTNPAPPPAAAAAAQVTTTVLYAYQS